MQMRFLSTMPLATNYLTASVKSSCINVPHFL